MKKRTIIIVCVIVIVLLASGVVLAAGAVQNQDILWFVRKSKALQKDDTVLLTVNGAEIYISDVEMELESSFVLYSGMSGTRTVIRSGPAASSRICRFTRIRELSFPVYRR